MGGVGGSASGLSGCGGLLSGSGLVSAGATVAGSSGLLSGLAGSVVGGVAGGLVGGKHQVSIQTHWDDHRLHDQHGPPMYQLFTQPQPHLFSKQFVHQE